MLPQLPFAFLYSLISLLPVPSAGKQHERVKLSSVKSLTLRQGLKTAANRATAVPQLKCVGGTAKGFYEIDVLRCKNAGSSYDDADVEWTCTASLPAEFKLGSTDVSCEGFTGPDDPYVLKGSCGVEYRLMLTKLGEERYGRGGSDLWENFPTRSKGGDIAAIIFWLAFIGILIWMVYAAFFRERGAGRRPGTRGGLGGWGGGGGDDDPPPPYDPRPPPSKPRTYASRPHQTGPGGGAWRPGFWTGLAGGAAGGYLAGNRNNRDQPLPPRQQGMWNNGEGSSNWGGGRTRSGDSSSSSSNYGSSRYESTGFGGTSRR